MASVEIVMVGFQGGSLAGLKVSSGLNRVSTSSWEYLAQFLGLPRPINPSFYHHSISLKSISTHNLVFGFAFGENNRVVLSAIIK